MLRRLLLVIFLTLFGFGVGLALGAILMRRMDQAAAEVGPDQLAGRVRDAASRAGDRLWAAWRETVAAAADKEAELRRRYEVHSRDTLTDGRDS